MECPAQATRPGNLGGPADRPSRVTTPRRPVVLRVLMATVALALAVPTAALAQVEIDPVLPIIPPCPWWHCEPSEVVIEEYRVDTSIDDSVATTRITQVLRNDGGGLAEGRFLVPIPSDAAVTGLVLWINGEPVSGELLAGDAARRTYEEIVRKTLDPALLEFVDDDLLSLSVFPIPAGEERTVEIEYRQVLDADGGLVRYRHPMGREHRGVEIERIVARIEIEQPGGLKAVHSPTHAISLDRRSETRAVVGFEGSGPADGEFVLYFSTDPGPVSLDVMSYRDGAEGWFLLVASPGLAAPDTVTSKDLVVVLDVSGSMEGEKLAQARRAARFVLDDLNPDDRFELLAFSTATDSFGEGLRPASEAGAASAWIGGLAAGGSTDIHAALTEAFALAEPGRPLYVMFLTDGLPTDGIVDTQQILAALPRSETVSVFAFGVGYDVDTILLDSIAREHHGTTEYVVPGEEIDTAVRSLSEKVASPVLTAVQIEVDGVVVSDLQPQPLPDIFSGGQLAVAGLYEGSGPASITLRGRFDGQPVSLEYEDVAFSTAGGDDSVPSLWATRKIGSLLRKIRIDGPDDETIEQIVQISIRHGIVTPYTSYLVTEPDPFGDEALADIAGRAAAAATTYAASGEAAVEAADAAADLSDAAIGAGSGDFGDIVVSAGGRTLRSTDGVWIDTTYDPSMTTHTIEFGSPEYFALAGAGPSLAAALAAGPRVIVVVDEIAYRVVTDGSAVEDPPSPTDIAEPADPTSPPSVASAIEPIGEEGDGSASTLIAVLSALAATAALALVAWRKS